MNWDQLITPTRLGSSRTDIESTRTAFQRDFDRIVFSAAFRRLQDKAQVFPLAQSDYVRTRLTHSLETASVGRSLGTRAGEEILRLNPEAERIIPYASIIGDIVAAACLAHDIGNPPFGHAGEDAIATWFTNTESGWRLIERLRADGAPAEEFLHFEGNAQGFRLLTRLEHAENDGGMQLTCSTLAAFTKYPWSVQASTDGRHKYGFFNADTPLFRRVAKTVGLNEDEPTTARHSRHPLAFLVEAADDICYHVVDIEDGFRMKLLPQDEAESLLHEVLDDNLSTARLHQLAGNADARIQLLRAKAIGSLVEQAVHSFAQNLDRLLNGNFKQPLTGTIERATNFAKLKETAVERVYPERGAILINAAGFNVLGQLIETFVEALNDAAQSTVPSAQSRTICQLFQHENGRKIVPKELSLYERLLTVTDYVSSLTDRNAVALYKRLTGISLPGQ